MVIGAGNTAIDCATVARRLGAERVTIVYRRTEKEMSAYRHEFEFAKAEGIEFRFLAQPTRVVATDTGVIGLECASVSLGQRRWKRPAGSSARTRVSIRHSRGSDREGHRTREMALGR